MIRTLIVDDQELVRTGFSLILATQPDIDVVAEAANGRDAVAACHDLAPDVVLMDVRMPIMDGIEATRQITREPGVQVLMLTTFDLDEHVYEAFQAGVSGFLLKDVRRNDLVHALHAVASGDTLVAPTITRRLVERFIEHPNHAGRTLQLQSLTPREIEILRFIGRGLSNTEIANQLVLAETTVKTHVSRILTKLNLRDRVQAVVLAYETGLVRTSNSGSARRKGQ